MQLVHKKMNNSKNVFSLISWVKIQDMSTARSSLKVFFF